MVVRRVLTFGVAGGTAAFVNLATVWLCAGFLLPGVHYTTEISVALGILVSTGVGFFLHRSWTWSDRRRNETDFVLLRTLVQFYGVCAASAALQWLVAVGSRNLLGVHYLSASVAGIGVAAVANYIGVGRWVFTAQQAARTQLVTE